MKRSCRALQQLALGWVAVLCVSVGPVAADTTTAMGDQSGEGSTPFTGLAQTPEANLFTGALATSIPIEIPPGRKDATPRLALQYSSTGGPSPFGYGWDVPLGRIQRSTKWGVPRCTGEHTDDFVLNMPGGTAELVNDPAGPELYRPKVEEKYLVAKKDEANNRWTVYDASGMKYQFGSVSTARIGNDTSVFMNDSGGSCRFTTAWGLTRVEDRNGNSIDISYNNADNVLYPITVKYGGRATAPTQSHYYQVGFEYEYRDPDTDIIENYMAGVRSVLRLRATRIRVKYLTTGDTIRLYQLYYDSNPDPAGPPGYQSMLNAVTLDQLPDHPGQTFSYAPANVDYTANSFAPVDGNLVLRSTEVNGTHRTDVKRTLLDMNADGFVDIVQADLGAPPGYVNYGTWRVYPGSAAGFSAQVVAWGGVPENSYHVQDQHFNECGTDWVCTARDTFDINGDGIPDRIDARQPTWQVSVGQAFNQNGQGAADLALPRIGRPLRRTCAGNTGWSGKGVPRAARITVSARVPPIAAGRTV